MPSSPLSMQYSPGFWHWLDSLEISLAFTTYQTNRLFLLGRKPGGRLAVNERLFDRPMGLTYRDGSLFMTCRYQIWQLENRLASGEEYQGHDRLFVPSLCHTTGDVNSHDIVAAKSGKILFINTDYSCVAGLKPGFSFEPLWQPAFITQLVAEDRCHLNGLAMIEDDAVYATACSLTNTAASWRDHRAGGGAVIHIPSGEITASGLSMPHSPRWRRNKLWLLNSGSGEFGYVDQNRFQPVAFCPGFLRGLAFYGNYAIIGLSKLRSKAFSGLVLENRLAAERQSSQCGLRVIDLTTGETVHHLQIDGVVEEIFDIVVLPDTRLPKALGFQNDDIARLVNFPNSAGLTITKPAVARRNIHSDTPTEGFVLASQAIGCPAGGIKYQRVYHLNQDNLTAYETMTCPSLRARWQTQPLRGELAGVSASKAGEMIGLAVAEILIQDNGPRIAELISLYVLPDYRRRGIGTALVNHLRRQFGELLNGESISIQRDEFDKSSE